MSGQSEYERHSRDLQSLRRQIADQSSKVASARKAEGDARMSASRASSSSTQQMRLRDAQRQADAAVAAEKKRAGLESDAAAKEKRVYEARATMDKERQRDQERAQRTQENAQKAAMKKLEDQLRAQQSQSIALGHLVSVGENVSPLGVPQSIADKFDVFISHASEDKDDVARPLYMALVARGMRVWFDEATLVLGDSLRRKIDEGLANSEFGVVILSHNFFAKEWPQVELDGLFARQVNDQQKVILPLWHNISRDEVQQASPTLVGTVALLTATQSIEDIAEAIVAVVTAGRDR